MKMKTQNETVLEMLKAGAVTPMDALRECGCFRLAARINDLRNSGWVINTDNVSQNGKTFASYNLVGRGTG
jgi:hypothetical protein